MADNFTVRIDELPEWTAKLRRFPGVVGRHLVTGVNRTTTEGEARSKRYVGKDTRHLMRGITAQPARFAGGSVQGAWGTNVPYGEVHEKGRGAGKPMPPKGVLLGWMARHGIPAKAEFVIRRSIGQKGIVGKRYMQRSFDEIKPLFRREMRTALHRALNEIGGGRR